MADRTMVDYTRKIKPYFEGIAPIEPTTTAALAHAVGDVFYLNGTKVKCTVAISVGDTIAIGTNVEEADDTESEIEALTNKLNNEIVTRSALGAKNLAKPINSTTYNGITVVCDSDGVLTITGTSTGSGGRLNIIGDPFTLKAGTYKVVQNSDDLTKYSSIVCHRSSDNTSLGYVLIENGAINNTNAQFTLAADTECFLGMNTYQGTDYGTGAGTKEYAMVVLADDTDDTYAPYAKTNRELTAENQTLTQNLDNEIATRAQLGAHNLFDSKRLTQASPSGGITFAVGDDGSLSITGGTTSAVFQPYGSYVVKGVAIPFKPNTSYTFSIGEGKKQENINLKVYYKATSGSNWTVLQSASNVDEIVFTTPASFYDIIIRPDVSTGKAITTTTLYPLVKLASDPSSKFTPYAKTNQQLTEDTNAIEPMLNVLGTKNLLKNTASSATVYGVTFTVNPDGSVTANGTATGNAYIRVANITDKTCVLNKGKYTFNGCPAGGSLSGYYAYATDDTTSFNDIGNGVDFTISSDNTPLAVIIYVRNGTTVSNLTFYPMIRPANIEDDTFVPYAMTNRELTEKSIIKDVSGYSWDSAIDGTKDIRVKRYGAIVSVYGYFRSTNALAQYADVLSGLPHCASGAAKSADMLRNMGMTLQNVDSATSKFVVDSATTANLQYAFNFVYLTDAN